MHMIFFFPIEYLCTRTTLINKQVASMILEMLNISVPPQDP